ncbi:MAG: anthrone oxygenase family protein [Bacteroidota bacterium]
MELNIKLTVLLIGIVFTGLTAGICFTWGNAVTPGIGRINDYGFLSAFQAMNRAIINKVFMMVFFGPVIALFISAYLFKANTTAFWFILAAAMIYLFGLALVTVFGNVLLNEILDKSNLEAMSALELKELRKTLEKP